LAQVAAVAAEAKAHGVRPAVVWHSGKLRAKQTAEVLWRECNALATFSASRDLQPDDRPEWIHDRVQGETRDILIAGHFPHLPRLLARLLRNDGGVAEEFPSHGIIALATDDKGATWRKEWSFRP
jgi:phosphohistidine phosphatase